MLLQNIQLVNFKNLENVKVTCGPNVNCLIGKNGSGKTNFLDAIYYLSATKSAFNTTDSQNILHDQPFFTILAHVEQDGKPIKVQCSLMAGQKKIFKWNEEEYEKLSAHVGRFPLVMITPYDTDLIRDGSEPRRRYFDMVISQFQKPYLQTLIRYNHFLKQRNALLKNMAQSNRWDKNLLDPYDMELLKAGKMIAETRRDFVLKFQTECHEYYKLLSGDAEQTSIEYHTDVLQPGFDEQFKAQRQEDIQYQRTTLGTHRDDYKLLIGGKPLKRFGSQGQQKSMVISLKLAHFKTLERELGTMPLLLLDDIFDKLDDERIKVLISMVKGHEFGQIFITDARLDRAQSMLGDSDEVMFYQVCAGSISLLE